MYANQLIGKMAIRVAPVDRGEEEVGYGTGIVVRKADNSFTREPILILAATESHIIYKFHPEYSPLFNDDKKRVLNYEYCDNNWTSWDDLISLADEKHIELMRKLQE